MGFNKWFSKFLGLFKKAKEVPKQEPLVITLGAISLPPKKEPVVDILIKKPSLNVASKKKPGKKK